MTGFDPLLLSRAAAGDAAAAGHLAEQALDIGLEEQALPIVQAAATRVRTDATLWQWLGALANAIDRNDVALPAFDAAAALLPRHAGVARGRARVALAGGAPALPLFAAALALEPLNGEALLGRASATVASGEVAAAAAELDAVLRVHPGWLEGQQALARLRWLAGEGNRFLAGIERALLAAPRDPGLHRLRLSLLLQARDFPAVIAAARVAGTVPDLLAFATGAAAAAHAEQGSVEAADHLFATIPTTDAATLIYRARHLLRQHRPDAAAALLVEQSAAGGNRGAWPYLSVAWRLLGDPRHDWLEQSAALVRVVDTELSAAECAELATLLRAVHRLRRPHLAQSVRGGAQTDEPVFGRMEPIMRRMRAMMAAAVEDYRAALPPVDPAHPLLQARRDRPVRFAGSWSVRLAAGGHHTNHVHPHGWLSSVCYIDLPDGLEKDGGHAGWLTLGAPDADLGLALPPTRLVAPRPGRLVLFPSYTWHGTVPFTAGERLTLAFDVATPA